MKTGYDEWLRRARSNLELAQVRLIPHVYYEDLCFNLQQSAEKALKGLLIYYGVEPEFTHNIERLLTELEKHTGIPANVKEAANLTDYAVFTRYPEDYDDITKEDYEKSVITAKNCFQWVENTIKENEENKEALSKLQF